MGLGDWLGGIATGGLYNAGKAATGGYGKAGSGSFWGGLIGGAPGTAVGAYLGSHGDDPANAASAWGSRPDPYAGIPAAPKDASSGVSLDRTGLDAYSKEALRTGPSTWSKLALGQNENNRVDAFNRSQSQAGAQGQQAQDQLAMTGGLTGGAAERTAMSTGRNALDVGQDVNNQANQNALQIGINDEQNRVSELSQLPGMDQAASGFDLSKAQGQNQFNANNYSTQGGIWAAGQQADLMDPRNPNSPNYDDQKRWYNPFTW